MHSIKPRANNVRITAPFNVRPIVRVRHLFPNIHLYLRGIGDWMLWSSSMSTDKAEAEIGARLGLANKMSPTSERMWGHKAREILEGSAAEVSNSPSPSSVLQNSIFSSCSSLL